MFFSSVDSSLVLHFEDVSEEGGGFLGGPDKFMFGMLWNKKVNVKTSLALKIKPVLSNFYNFNWCAHAKFL